MPLTRAQATAFLLPSLTQAAHLHLSADLSFVEGDRAALAAAAPPPPPPHGPSVPHPFPQLAGSTNARRRSSLGPALNGAAHTATTTAAGSSRSAPHALSSLSGSTSHEDSLVATGPITPAPMPQTRRGDVDYGETVGVPLKSFSFERTDDGADSNSSGVKSGKRREGAGRVWVGREGGEGGNWVGVWQFGAEIGQSERAL